MNKQTFAITGGNALEWYDFSIYGYLSLVIADKFFPADNLYLSLLLTFTTYAISFLMRPIGGFVLGRLGDKISRKLILLISITAVSIFTLLIGLLPSYQRIGITAPILLISLRMLQGFFISSEFTGATTYQIESNRKRAGFLGSLVQSSTFVGSMLGSLVVTAVIWYFSTQQLYAWAWRIPFLLGPLFGLYVFKLRLTLTENIAHKTTQQPTVKRYTAYKKHFAIAFFIPCAATAGIYYFIYQINVLVNIVKASMTQAMLVLIVCKAVTIIGMPLFALIADKIGKRRFSSLAVGLLLVLALPLFWLMSRTQLTLIISGQLLFSLVLAAFLSVNTVIIAELFPRDIRFASCAFILNLSIALFGATTPMISLFLSHLSANPMMPALYFMLTCLLSLLALYAYAKLPEVTNLDKASP